MLHLQQNILTLAIYGHMLWGKSGKHLCNLFFFSSLGSYIWFVFIFYGTEIKGYSHNIRHNTPGDQHSSIGRSWPGLMKHIFFLHHVDGQMHLHHLTGDQMVPGCAVGRRQPCGVSVCNVWAMCCWEALGPAILLNILWHVPPTKALLQTMYTLSWKEVLPDGCGLFQQDNAPYHKAKMAQGWFEVLTWPPNSQVLNPIGVFWTN